MKVQLDSNFYYDPQRQGFNENLWKILSGSISVASNKIRVSAASIIHYADLFRGFFNLVANVPATPTSALLTGGTGATAVFGTWAAVTNGSFKITIDGTAYTISGIVFTGAGDMAAVAAVIQAAIRTATGNAFETCVWSTNKFIITVRSGITVTTAGGVGTDISGAGGTAFMDCDTGQGTVTAATNSNKKWGLIQLNKNLKCYFELRGDTLVAVTSDETGTAEETDITWDDTNWTAEDIKFEIDWSGHSVKFKIDGDQVAFHETRNPRGPLSVYVFNEFADNFDFKYFEFKEIETVT